MSIITTGVLFVVALFCCIAVMAHLTRERVVEQTLKEARARRSPVADFVDDLQQHRWIVIIVLALLVALDQHFGFSRGLLQSRLTLAIGITLIFGARLLLRRGPRHSPGLARSAGIDPPEQQTAPPNSPRLLGRSEASGRAPRPVKASRAMRLRG